MKKMIGSALLVMVGILAAALPAAAGTTINLLENYRFDGPLERAGDISPWTVTHANGDKVKCAALRAPVTNSAPCMFMFKGGTEATTLKQKLNTEQLNAVNGFLDCAAAELYPWFYIHTAAPADVRLTVKVKYRSGRVDYSLKASEAVLPLLGSWQPAGDGEVFLPLGAEVSSFVYQIRHNSPSGKVFIDDAHLDIIPAPSVC